MNEIPMPESEEVLVDDGEEQVTPEVLEKLAAAFKRVVNTPLPEEAPVKTRTPNRAERRAEEKAMKTGGRTQRKLDAIAASRYHAAKNRRKKTRNG